MNLMIAMLIAVSLALGVCGLALILLPRRVTVQRRLLDRPRSPERRASDTAQRQALSSVKELNTVLDQIPLSRRIETLLRSAGCPLNVSSFVLLIATAGMAVALVVWWTSGLAAAALVGGALGGAVPVVWLAWQRQKRLRAFEKQLPDVLDMMINALKSGAGLPAALAMVAEDAPDPARTEFGILLQQQKFGLDFRECLRDMRRRVQLVDVQLFATAMLVQKETGGNLAEVLEQIAALVRDRFRIMGDARTLTAEGRLSGIILAVLPVVLCVAMFCISPENARFFIDTPIGRLMLGLAAVMEVVGFIVVRKICNLRV